ncbi:hypothetical protein ACFY4I_13015 [Streptomyces scabiei]
MPRAPSPVGDVLRLGHDAHTGRRPETAVSGRLRAVRPRPEPLPGE